MDCIVLGVTKCWTQINDFHLTSKPSSVPLPPSGLVSHTHLYMLSCFSCVWVFVAHQDLLSMGFSRHEYWNGLPYSLPRDLPNPGIKPTPLPSPALAGKFFTTSTTWETLVNHVNPLYCIASVALGSPSILPVLVLPVCLDCKFFKDMKTHVYWALSECQIPRIEKGITRYSTFSKSVANPEM